MLTLYLSSGQFVTARYIQGHAGAGQLKVNYPQLDFTPSTLFALGSPVAVFLSLRGVQDLGEFFHLPTCPRVFNIFHPVREECYIIIIKVIHSQIFMSRLNSVDHVYCLEFNIFFHKLMMLSFSTFSNIGFISSTAVVTTSGGLIHAY